MVHVPTGPAGIRFTWEKNGRALETCVPMQTHVLTDGRAHALSWLRDAIQESTEYRCSVLSSSGNQTSKVRVTVRQEAAQQEKWNRELTTWRAVVGEHDRLMQGWRKAWGPEPVAVGSLCGKAVARIPSNHKEAVPDRPSGRRYLQTWHPMGSRTQGSELFALPVVYAVTGPQPE
ncbi:hypothetical protein H920_16453 [Fukomys damarensis]|uniref:Semaphorin-4D n=1 Tax=Fukomys damarensis TaxID=885580 RepID=A0A091CS73_FUKDA|nr:hypothetical protein H920_16453 [Fukomys damarensis]